MHNDEFVSFSHLARYGLLEQFFKHESLYQLVYSIVLDESHRSEAYKSFIERNKLGDESDISTFLAHRNIQQEDKEYIVLRDALVQSYLNKEFTISRVKARYLANRDSISSTDFQVLSFKNEASAIYAFVKASEEQMTFEEIKSLLSGDCTLNDFTNENLSNVSKGIKYLICSKNVGKVCPPVQFNDLWRVIKVSRLYRPRLDDELEKKIRMEMLDERINEACRLRMASLTSSC